MEKPIFVVDIDDYDDSSNNDYWCFEFSQAGFKKALEKVKEIVSWYGAEDLEWSDGDPTFDHYFKNSCNWFSDNDALYIGICKKTMWVSESLEIE